MSMEHCYTCDHPFDTDYFAECPHCEELFECDQCGKMHHDVRTVFSPIMGDTSICGDCLDEPVCVREAADPVPAGKSKVLCFPRRALPGMRDQDQIGNQMGHRPFTEP